eukprot:scaffold97598_cov33-Tisochrysis_lutea.AAC.1
MRRKAAANGGCRWFTCAPPYSASPYASHAECGQAPLPIVSRRAAHTGKRAFATKRSVKARTGGSASTFPTIGRLRRKPSTTGKKSPKRLRKPKSSIAIPMQ